MTKKESFADLFEKQALPSRRRLSIGDKLTANVAHVGPDAVFVDLDGKHQAYFDRIELGDRVPKVGDPIEGIVVAIDDAGQVRLARGLTREAGLEKGAALEHLRSAKEGRVPVEGKITAINKGGAEVDIAGVRAFCPMSQLDNRFVENPAELVGQSLFFHVTEVRERDVVLSRRTVREEEARSARDATLGGLQVGAVRQGRVTQLREFGAFVDLGGIDGLIPLRELSHERARPEDVVAVGDVVEVQVREVQRDGDKTRITLSLKALSKDPWDMIEALAPIGTVLSGQVSRLEEYGAFVRIAPGVEGLLHVSQLSARARHPSDVLQVGAQVLVVAESIDKQRRRISLAPAGEDASAGTAAKAMQLVLHSVVPCVVEKIERFGVIVQVKGTKGRAGRGVIPNAELAAKGTDIRREFPVGKELNAKIIETGEGRLRLSVRGAGEDAERAVYDQYRQDVSSQKMGSLGDLLKNKLKKP